MPDDMPQNGVIHGFHGLSSDNPPCSVPFFPGPVFTGHGKWETVPLNLYHLVYNDREARVYTNIDGRDIGMHLVTNARTSAHHGLCRISLAVYHWCKKYHAHETLPCRSEHLKIQIETAFDFSMYTREGENLMLPLTTPSHQGTIVVQCRAPSSGANAPDAITVQPRAPCSGPAPPLRSRPRRSFAAPYPPTDAAPAVAAPAIALESSTGAAPVESTPEAAHVPATAFKPSAGVAPVENAADALSTVRALAEGGAGAKGHVQTNGWIVSSKGEALPDGSHQEKPPL
ncbi:hypothetical protein B0H19DRAFT_1074226 [Mycena capillaripes]|nr:hypothetical protein B0H19DRAFT_1074226 [Mycena capillaripes]